MANLIEDLPSLSSGQALDFGDSLHRGAPLLDPPTMSPEQAHARRWRQYECDKIQADIYRAQERQP